VIRSFHDRGSGKSQVAKRPIELPPWETFVERMRNVLAAKAEIDKIVELKERTGGFTGRFRTCADDIDDLAGRFGGKADYIFTDPPYGGASRVSICRRRGTSGSDVPNSKISAATRARCGARAPRKAVDAGKREDPRDFACSSYYYQRSGITDSHGATGGGRLRLAAQGAWGRVSAKPGNGLCIFNRQNGEVGKPADRSTISTVSRKRSGCSCEARALSGLP
jgi:hypothetical protein